MKARVIATGRIVEVVANENYYDTTDNKERYYSHELDFNDTADYWTRLEHQYAGMAMQAYIIASHISQFSFCEGDMGDCKNIAHALVEKYKKEEK